MSSPRLGHDTDLNRGSYRQSDHHDVVRSADQRRMRSLVVIHQGDDLVAADLDWPMPRPGAQPECEFSGIRPRHRTPYTSHSQRPYECFDPPRRDQREVIRHEKGVLGQQACRHREKRANLETRGRDSRRRRYDQAAEKPSLRLSKREVVIHQPHIQDFVVDSKKSAPKGDPKIWKGDEDSSFDMTDDSFNDPPSAPSLRYLNTPELSPIRGTYFPELDGTKFSSI